MLDIARLVWFMLDYLDNVRSTCLPYMLVLADVKISQIQSSAVTYVEV